MYSYRAYGLNIRTNFPLPEFVAADGRPDVEVRLLSSYASTDALQTESQFDFDGDQIVLSFQHAGVFRVRGGRDVEIQPASGADELLLRLYLVGKVFGTVLYQRGLLVLHASSVEIDGRAVAFMGTSLFGKSSVAASLLTCGHRLVADDVAAVERCSGVPFVRPAFPQLKLDPAVGERLGYDRQSLVQLHAFEMRGGLRVPDRFAAQPLPLSLIYLLSAEDHQPADPAPHEALIELVRHSFPARLNRSGGAAHLRECASLMKDVPVRGLGRQEARGRPHDLSRKIRADLDSRR
jgi:hypothetical protein